MSQAAHANCVVCGTSDALGLGLEFKIEADDSMCVTIRDGFTFQGYSGRLHGGIISVLFDAAMTHCLFAHGLVGVTASLNIRFLQAVTPNRPIVVRAHVERQKSKLALLKGTLQQDGELKSSAEARFWIVSRATSDSVTR